MKYLVAVDGDAEEARVLKSALTDVIACITDEYWDTRFFSIPEEGRQYMTGGSLVDFAFCDVTLQGVTAMLPELRKYHEEMGLLLIADDVVSPLEYLKPGIRADSLLIRPYSRRMLDETLKEFFREGLARKDQNAGEQSFVMESKEGKTFIPYDDIFYFESREKKVFVRLLNEEYGFYSTMDELEGLLPKQFTRCHRSFIVNRCMIKRVLFSQNLIELTKDFTVPLSRSYKQQLKEIG